MSTVQPEDQTLAVMDERAWQLLLREYEKLREEIISRVNIRQAMWGTLLLGAGTLLTFALQPGAAAPWVALLYILLSFFLACAWGHNDGRIAQIVGYLREVEQDTGFAGWETRRSQRHSKHRGLHAFAAQGAFACTQLAAIIIAYGHLMTQLDPLRFWIVIILAALAFSTTWQVLRDRK